MKKALTLLLLLPGAALAHTDGTHLHTGMDGFFHPFLGWDHLLALVAAGLCAACAAKPAARGLQLGVILALAVGILGASFLPTTNLESAIAASLIVAGAWVSLVRSVPAGLSIAVLSIAMFSHGWVHGQELTAATPFAFASGLLLASALIIAATAGAGRWLAARTRYFANYLLGGAVAVIGLVLSV